MGDDTICFVHSKRTWHIACFPAHFSLYFWTKLKSSWGFPPLRTLNQSSTLRSWLNGQCSKGSRITKGGASDIRLALHGWKFISALPGLDQTCRKVCQLEFLQADAALVLEDGGGKIKAVCCDLGHCSLLFKSDPNAVYSPPNAVYWLQDFSQRSSFLTLLSFAATPPFKPEKNNTWFVF